MDFCEERVLIRLGLTAQQSNRVRSKEGNFQSFAMQSVSQEQSKNKIYT